MRRASNNKSFIIENEVFYGVSLGWDFCAEHEWGIKGMRRHFGIDTNKVGFEGRKITKGNVLFKKGKDLCVLTSQEPYGLKENYTAKDLLGYDIKAMYQDFETAWDENDFCIATKNKEEFKYLEELNEAFKNKNIIITFLKSELPAFSNSALSILIADKLPEEAKQEMYNVDKKSIDLVEYEKKIGVTSLKQKTRGNGYKGDKYFLACSPRWIDYENPENREKRKKEYGTKYDIIFWVNYSDDDDNFGWYNAEDIIKWLSTPGLKLKSLNKEKV